MQLAPYGGATPRLATVCSGVQGPPATTARADNSDVTPQSLDDAPKSPPAPTAPTEGEVEEYSYQSRPLAKAFLFEIVANKRNGRPDPCVQATG